MKDFSDTFDEVYGRWSDVLVRIDTSNCRTIMRAFEDVCQALDAFCPEGEQINWHAFGSGREPAPSVVSQALIEAKEAQLEEFIVERTKTAGRLVLPRGAMLSAVKHAVATGFSKHKPRTQASTSPSSSMDSASALSAAPLRRS
eukprot:TRINITY_DN872_c0_g1_i5.p4 TRINITY_DN872_c0_g1~~TRINITY_DN872_c0_g1_i5.p4  ORF type:complete len:144 (+),score=35.97 TRINITY_DN872_c0_g1_i5:816-1247(+)